MIWDPEESGGKGTDLSTVGSELRLLEMRGSQSGKQSGKKLMTTMIPPTISAQVIKSLNKNLISTSLSAK